MSRHKPDLDPVRCEELHEKIRAAKKRLDQAFKDFEDGSLTAAVAAEAAEYYSGALQEYDQHCGGKRVI